MDWRKVAENIVDHHTVQPTKMEVPDRKCAVFRLNLITAIADALQDAARIAENGTVSYGPAPGKPVLVNDKWLEHLNNKLAQINQRLNETEGQLRGMGDIVTKQDVRLQTIETTLRVADWAKQNLPPRSTGMMDDQP